jgi:hypothetical protein
MRGIGLEYSCTSRLPFVDHAQSTRSYLDHAGSLPSFNPAAFVAFNPGFGHPHLTDMWKPTLDVALQCPHSPMVLWTAHSDADMQRDVEFLDSYVSQRQGVVDWLLAPMVNPFASRKRVAGGIGEDKEAVVQANMHVGVFRVRRL